MRHIRSRKLGLVLGYIPLAIASLTREHVYLEVVQRTIEDMHEWVRLQTRIAAVDTVDAWLHELEEAETRWAKIPSMKLLLADLRKFDHNIASTQRSKGSFEEKIARLSALGSIPADLNLTLVPRKFQAAFSRALKRGRDFAARQQAWKNIAVTIQHIADFSPTLVDQYQQIYPADAEDVQLLMGDQRAENLQHMTNLSAWSTLRQEMDQGKSIAFDTTLAQALPSAQYFVGREPFSAALYKEVLSLRENFKDKKFTQEDAALKAKLSTIRLSDITDEWVERAYVHYGDAFNRSDADDKHRTLNDWSILRDAKKLRDMTQEEAVFRSEQRMKALDLRDNLIAWLGLNLGAEKQNTLRTTQFKDLNPQLLTHDIPLLVEQITQKIARATPQN